MALQAVNCNDDPYAFSYSRDFVASIFHPGINDLWYSVYVACLYGYFRKKAIPGSYQRPWGWAFPQKINPSPDRMAFFA
jgi:hypothetical protein